jgi:hypothetical protein
MTIRLVNHRPPAPLDLLIQLLDERADRAEASLLTAGHTGDPDDLRQAEAHRAALDQLTVRVLGGTPSATSKTFDAVAVPVWTPQRHWHLAVTDGTVRWLDNLAIDDTDPDALVDGLLAMVTIDQRHLALRLRHPDEVAEEIGRSTGDVHNLIDAGHLGYCDLAGTTWVVDT